MDPVGRAPRRSRPAPAPVPAPTSEPALAEPALAEPASALAEPASGLERAGVGAGAQRTGTAPVYPGRHAGSQRHGQGS
ncbi:hypothetical protein GCM10023322_59420 [Rugosimonospora acidiphila]|uniref:Uncharacterized protein n=1 Tax=Rugosimonospora acidiphila TaxID=556531 RepID=A0ABP9SDR2_9ACTN